MRQSYLRIYSISIVTFLNNIFAYFISPVRCSTEESSLTLVIFLIHVAALQRKQQSSSKTRLICTCIHEYEKQEEEYLYKDIIAIGRYDHIKKKLEKNFDSQVALDSQKNPNESLDSWELQCVSTLTTFCSHLPHKRVFLSVY